VGTPYLSIVPIPNGIPTDVLQVIRRDCQVQEVRDDRERGLIACRSSQFLSVSNSVAVRVPAALTWTVHCSLLRCSPAPSVAQLPETWQ